MVDEESMSVFSRILFVVLMIILPVSVTYADISQNLASMLQHLQTNLGPVYKLVIATSFVLGIWFITDAIFRFKKFAQARTMMSSNTTMAKPLIIFVIGLGLLYFPTMIDVSVQTLWLQSSSSILRYPTDTGMWDSITHPLIDLVRLFGLIAFVRGMLILTRLGSESPQPGSVAKGLMHITGGILAVNIVGTINMIEATFGLS